MGKFREAELPKCMFLLANLNDRMYVCIVTLLESYTVLIIKFCFVEMFKFNGCSMLL